MTKGSLSTRRRNVATRPRAVLATLALALAALLAPDLAHAPAQASPQLRHTALASARPPAPASTDLRARSARLLKVDDSGHLHLLQAFGEVIEEEGRATGSLPGTVFVRMNVGAGNVTASFTIRSEGGGSIAGHGEAVLHGSGRYSSFSGTLSVSHGSGRYSHAHGDGKLYGTIERTSTKHLTVQTIGTLDY
jgi:hypothetical protein